jgi:hypothetical protein
MFDTGRLCAKGGDFADGGERPDGAGKPNPGDDLVDVLEPERVCPPAKAALGGGSPWS